MKSTNVVLKKVNGILFPPCSTFTRIPTMRTDLLHLPPTVQQETNKISYLDGIRGLAALLVFFHHFFLVFYGAYYNWDPAYTHLNGWDIKYGKSAFSVFTNGQYCVCIFFVLSGFVLSHKYFKANHISTLISGAQRRFVRLYIPVAATLILSYLLMKAHLYRNVTVSILTHSEWWFGGMWTFLHATQNLWNCLWYDTMFRTNASFDTTLWTMPIEFYNSLIVFGFLALTHKVRHRFRLLLVMLLFCYLTDNQFLAAFIMGIAINYIEIGKARLKPATTVWLPILLLAGGLILGSYPSAGSPKSTLFAFVTPPMESYFAIWAHVVGAMFVIVAFVLSPRLQHFISMRFFRFLGYISFSLYLLHPLVMGTFSSFLFLGIHNLMSYGQAVAIVWVATGLVCFLVSWLMTKYIDGPGVQLSKYIYAKYIKSPALQAE